MTFVQTRDRGREKKGLELNSEEFSCAADIDVVSLRVSWCVDRKSRIYLRCESWRFRQRDWQLSMFQGSSVTECFMQCSLLVLLIERERIKKKKSHPCIFDCGHRKESASRM